MKPKRSLALPIERLESRRLLAASGSISGVAFRDVVYNGGAYEPAAGDTGMPTPVIVFLDADNDATLDPGETRTTTNPTDGRYAFSDLPDAFYNVRQVVPQGYIGTTAATAANVTEGGVVSDVNFANFPLRFTGGRYHVVAQPGNAAFGGVTTLNIRADDATTYIAPKNKLPSLDFIDAQHVTFDLSGGEPFFGPSPSVSTSAPDKTPATVEVLGRSTPEWIEIAAGATSDVLNVNLEGWARFSCGRANPLTLSMGGGDDFITLATPLKNLRLDGGAGADACAFVGPAPTADVRVTATAVSMGNCSFAHDGIEDLRLLADATGRTIDVDLGGAPTALRAFTSSRFDDRVNLAGVAAPLRVLTLDGSDQLTVSASEVKYLTMDAGGFSGRPVTDTLIINGTPGDDVISTAPARLNTTFEHILINGFGGDDRITLGDEVYAHAVTLTGGDGNDVLQTDQGWHYTDLTLNGDAGDDTIILNNEGSVLGVYDGGAGVGDTMVVNGSPSHDRYNVIGGTIEDQRVPDVDSSTTPAGFESLVFNLLDGFDELYVSSSLVPLKFEGGDDRDSITLSDADSMTNTTYLVEPTGVTRAGAVILSYNAVEALFLSTGQGDDNISVRGKTAGPWISVWSGPGNDVLTVAAAPEASVSFSAGYIAGETDTLNIDSGTCKFWPYSQQAADVVVNLRTPDAAVVFEGSTRLKVLNIDAGKASITPNGGYTLVTETLSAAGGRLDLADNQLVVRNGAAGTFVNGRYDGIAGLIASGRGEDGLWTGNGIVTSMHGAGGGAATLGHARAADILGIAAHETAVWNGQAVNGDAIVVKYTWAGDANLDGFVDGGDYAYIDAFVNASASDVSYLHGDFNYDGYIDGGDYAYIDVTVGSAPL